VCVRACECVHVICVYVLACVYILIVCLCLSVCVELNSFLVQGPLSTAIKVTLSGQDVVPVLYMMLVLNVVLVPHMMLNTHTYCSAHFHKGVMHTSSKLELVKIRPRVGYRCKCLWMHCVPTVH
jgi:hypothetical protein